MGGAGGEDSDGDLWEESWVSVAELSADLRAEASSEDHARLWRRSCLARAPDAPTASRVSTSRKALGGGPTAREGERHAAVARSTERDRAPTPELDGSGKGGWPNKTIFASRLFL